MTMIHGCCCLLLAGLLLLASHPSVEAGEPAASPFRLEADRDTGSGASILLDTWALDIELGSIWQVGNGTPIDYHLLPLVLGVRTPAHLRWELSNGATLAVRGRFNLLLEAVSDGPESHYFGLSASPSFEYWLPGEETYFHFAIGGGAGWIDSRDTVGGQGQDFTLNWFMHGGLRHFVSERLALSLGVYYQHLSNGGATDPNPGIDAVGPMAGLSWHF